MGRRKCSSSLTKTKKTKKKPGTVQMCSFPARTDISTWLLLLLQSPNAISIKHKLLIQQNLLFWWRKWAFVLELGFPRVIVLTAPQVHGSVLTPTPLSSLCNKTNYSQTRITGSHALHFASDLKFHPPPQVFLWAWQTTVARDEKWPHSGDETEKKSWRCQKSDSFHFLMVSFFFLLSCSCQFVFTLKNKAAITI